MDLDSRLEAGRRLRVMYRGLGMDLAACAQFLQVTERTLHNWQSGRHVIPFAVFKLLRLLNRMDLPGDTWAGWYFVGGKLVSPEGRAFIGTDSSWWSLLIRRSVLFHNVYERNIALERQLQALGAERRTVALACDARAVRRAATCPDRLAIGAARSAGPNLFLEHFGTQNFVITCSCGSGAMKVIAKGGLHAVA